ncbi:MAG: hypothetical protein PHZ26_04225 [Candidatus Gracilibacteria bacterium]|nr:hypothetical protein [Candidatus Gracilibacteria bacterium]MDD2908934.1 hypothetical protein [Candidatus Gracilibacteria bacterium]
MAIINFRSAYEAIFKSFNVSADTELVSKLESDGIQKMIIIKRSWFFGLFISWMFVLMFIIMIANSYLIYVNFANFTVSGILISVLIFNILYRIFSVFLYFSKFKKIYGVRSVIVDTKVIKEHLNDGDLAFSKFFNQTIFNYFILVLITLFTAYEIVFVYGFNEVGFLGGLNIILLIVQMFLSTKFKKRMLDLEMDFAVVIPGKIILYNQSNLSRDVQTINSEKIKTITSKHAKLLGSIFDFGEITILTEGDEANMGEMTLQYIACPSETVYEINELLRMSENKGE